MVDVFIEFGDRARSRHLAARRQASRRRQRLARSPARSASRAVENLYRLSLNPTRQFDARNFTIVAEDLELTLAEGSVFTVDTDQGITGLVLLGRGEMRFHPTPETEKGQVRIFCGRETLESRFDAAYVRVGPVDAAR